MRRPLAEMNIYADRLREEKQNVEEAIDVTRLVLVRDQSQLPKTNDDDIVDAFSPSYVYQHFGENETIYGYDEPNVEVWYTAGTLKAFPRFRFNEKIEANADNVLRGIRTAWPEDQPMCNTVDQFTTELKAEKNFAPYGELLKIYKVDASYFVDNVARIFELYVIDLDFDKMKHEHHQSVDENHLKQYLHRVQSLAPWFIEAASYADLDDNCWRFYTIYEKYVNSDMATSYAFVGYASIYKFYAYPEHIKLRIAQMLVMPPYRRQQHGVHMLLEIYKYAWQNKRILRITVEDPSEQMTELRDYVDLSLCQRKLDTFKDDCLARQLLFRKSVIEEAAVAFKLSPNQIQRVYEIGQLRMAQTDDLLDKHRENLFKRLKLRYVRNDKQRIKAKKNMSPQEFTLFELTEMKGNELREIVNKDYKEVCAEYKKVIDRMEKYPLNDMF